ncbi:MAG: sigma-70 family RNA polymerase sigma factor [Acidimicrobiales bacterium]
MQASIGVTNAQLEWAETVVRLRRFVASRVGDRDVAEDITQDVIVRSIAAGALDRVDNPIGWLIRSASNAVIDHHRTRRTHDPLQDADPAGEEMDVPLGPDVRASLVECVRPMVERLDRPYREAITWVDLEGRTQAAAAAAAGVSLSGMKSRVQRARHQLKAMITACCDVEVDRRGGPIELTRRAGCDCSP